MFIHRETDVFLVDTGQVITSVGPRASVAKNFKLMNTINKIIIYILYYLLLSLEETIFYTTYNKLVCVNYLSKTQNRNALIKM